MAVVPRSQYRGNEGEHMTQERIQEYRRALEAKVVELSSIRHRAEEIAIERVPDTIDDVVLASERELAMEAINREALLLQNVLDALQRVRLGAFGICAECHENIAPRRLAAVPWAALCLTCQEAADRRSNPYKVHRGSLFSSAA
jgi:DnaK suppressor protein